jgi:hypothetical protein
MGGIDKKNMENLKSFKIFNLISNENYFCSLSVLVISFEHKQTSLPNRAYDMSFNPQDIYDLLSPTN